MTLESLEWCDYNMSRAYPLDDSTGGSAGTIPCDALIDCRLLTSGLSEAPLYISVIKNSGTQITLSIAVDGESTVFTDCVAIGFDCVKGASIDFETYADGDYSKFLRGRLIVGNIQSMGSHPTYVEYAPEQTKLFYGIVTPIDGLFITGIRVGDTVLTGDIVLEAGDGINLDVDPITDTIKITADRYMPPPDNFIITDDNTLKDNIVDTVGTPVTSINGCTPVDGNISITIPPILDEGEGLSDYVAAITPGAPGVLQLKLDKDPQLELDTVKTLAGNLSQLDIRSSKIIDSIDNLDSVLSSVTTQLTRLG